MNSRDSALATAPVGQLLFRLALPCVAAQLVNALYNIVDRIYIGHLPGNSGSLALAGLGICYPIIIIVSAFSQLIGAGGAPRAAIAMGADRQEDAQRILSCCCSVMVLVSLLLMGVFYLFGSRLLLLFGASADTLPYALSYLRIYLLGTLSVQLTLSMNAFITTQGFTKISMGTVMLGAVCNIILDPIFIYGFRMGVRGAALASVLSQTVSALWVLRFLTGKTTILRLQRRYLRPQLSIILPVLALGISPFIMQATESAVQACFNVQLRAYGGADADTLISGMSIMLSVLSLANLPCSGLGQGAQPITSFNYGAKRYDRVKENFFLLLRCTAVYMILFTTFCTLFPGTMGRLFSNDPAVVAVVEQWLPVFLRGTFFCFLLFSCQQTFVALGQAVRSMCVAMLRKVVLLIPLMFLLPQGIGLPGIILAEPIADICASITAAAVFYLFARTIFPKKSSVLL